MTLAELQAERLRTALAEACCDSCGTVPKKGKKECCSKKEAAPRMEPESETGQDIVVRMEQASFDYEFPDEESAKAFIDEAKTFGWSFMQDGPRAKYSTKAFADDVAAKHGGRDTRDSTTEAERPTTHPFIKRCVAAITKKHGGKPDRETVSRAFAICTAQKERSPKAAAAKKKEGVPKQRMKDYESALSSARKSDKK